MGKYIKKNNNNIGKWTLSTDKNEPNGQKLTKTCIENDLIINTFIQPKNGGKKIRYAV